MHDPPRDLPAFRMHMADVGASSVGALFGMLRTELGYSLADVEDAIRVRADYLGAIESMDARRLPGGPYTSGFLRTYAAFLGLDPQTALAAFNEEVATRSSLRFTAEKPKRSLPRPPPIVGVIAVAIAASGGGLWLMLAQDPGRGAPAMAPPVPQSLVAWVAAPPGASGERREASPAPLALRAVVEVRLTVWAAGERVLFDDLLARDEVFTLPTAGGVRFTVDNAGAVEVLVNGAPSGRLGPPGAPATDVTRAMLRAAAQPDDPDASESEDA